MKIFVQFFAKGKDNGLSQNGNDVYIIKLNNFTEEKILK